MHFIVVGLNHKTAPLAFREKLHFRGEVISDALTILNQCDTIKGSVILSTCNRIDVFASVKNINDGYEDIEHFLCKFHNILPEELQNYIYRKNCELAVSHLFKVAASLDSMVIGEYQIQGQLRDAYFIANENKATNNMINKLFQTAIQIGKQVRSQTDIGKGSLSVATLAVELIQQIFDKKENFKVLLIGAGKISNLTAENLKQFNTSIVVTNRSVEKATELALRFNGTVVDYQYRYEAVGQSDVIIVSTSSNDYTINKKELLKLNEDKQTKLRIFIDLSVPRNIDPAINELDNCHLYTIDDIHSMVHSNLSKRSKEIEKAEKIISAVSEDYYQWYAKQFIIPVMVELKEQLDVIKSKTIDSYKQSLHSFDSSQQLVMKKILDAYSDKLIRIMMKNIKKAISKEDIISITQSLKSSFTTDTES